MKQRTNARHIISTFIVIAALLGSADCGGLRHPATSQLSFEGQTAVAGRQFTAALRSASDGIDGLITTHILTNDDGVKSLQIVGTILQQNQNLAVVLKAIDEAKDIASREAGVQKATALIKTFQTSVNNVTVPISTEAGRQRVSAIMTLVSNALVDLTVALQRPAPGGLLIAA
jgi:hypothetical protein